MTKRDHRWNKPASHRIAIVSLARFSGTFSMMASGGGVIVYYATAESYNWLIAAFMFTWNAGILFALVMVTLWFMYAYLVAEPAPTPPPGHIPPPGDSYRSADGRLWKRVGGSDPTKAMEF